MENFKGKKKYPDEEKMKLQLSLHPVPQEVTEDTAVQMYDSTEK